MTLFLKLAWRNIWRNKRRSALTLAAIGFAIAVTIITRAMQYGTYERMILDAVGLFSGHLQIQDPGFRGQESLAYSFTWEDSLAALLNSIADVKAFAPRVEGEALVSAGENTTGALIVGIDPDREPQVTSLAEHVRRGQFLGGDSRGALVGDQLAQRLQVDLGDELVIIVQGYDGSLGADLYTVQGIVKTGLPEFDAAVVVMSLEAAQELFSLDNRLTELAVVLEEFHHLPRVVEELRQRLDSQHYAVLPWDKLMPELVQLIGFDKASGTVFIIVLIIVVGFGILNTVVMMVLERTREFGVMLSLGMRPGRLFALIVLETFLLSLTGLVVGTALGAGAGAYFAAHPLPLPGEASAAMEAIGFKASIYSKLTVPIFYESIALIVILTVVVSIFPALRAARLQPVEALRHA
jgi:ABC-type lipoprotein release transport system permease subunit